MQQIHRSHFFVGCIVSWPNCLFQGLTTMFLINKIPQRHISNSRTKTKVYHNLSVKIQLQFAQMVVALLSVTKAAMEGHPDNIDRSCLKKLMRLPRFLLTTTYYVGSITILVTVFRMNFVFILWLYFLNNALLYFHIFPSVSSLRDNCLFRTSINFLTVSRQLSI